VMKLETPEYAEDLALRLMRTGDLPAPEPAVPASKAPAPKKSAPARPAPKK